MTAAETSKATYLAQVTTADIPYEEELMHNPNWLRPWLRYLDHKTEESVGALIPILLCYGAGSN